MPGPIEVAITGLGAITPLGADVASTWDALLAGRSGITLLTADWAAELPARLAARMAVDPASRLERVEARKLDRGMQAAVVAAREAWADAGLAGAGVDPDRVAVVIGSGIGGLTTLMDNYDQLRTRGYRHVSPRMVQMDMPNGPAAAVSIDLDARAAAITPVSACATGAEAVAHGLDLIRWGRADVVVAGGTEACIHPITMAGFAMARALSTHNEDPAHASRPFDRLRDGFVLGEGCGLVILERAEHARSRGRRIYALLAGAAITADATDMVSPQPDALGQIRAVRAALQDADLSPADIVHVNAHATSTPTGDAVEAKGIAAAIGEHAVVCATKSMTGHLLGAGGVETVFTALAVHHGVVPPTPTLQEPDAGLRLDVTRGTPRYLRVRAALNNSFGFGGHNAAVILREP